MYNAVIYTSDMSLTSCYSMPQSPASPPITMTISTLSPPSSTSIYTSYKETFVEDIDAYVTIDIIQSKLMKPSWCPQEKQLFTVNPIAQATSYFSFETWTSDKKLAIT